MNLTFPEVVTPYNIDYLNRLVKNGRDVYNYADGSKYDGEWKEN